MEKKENVWLDQGQGPVRRVRLHGQVEVLVKSLREGEAGLKAKDVLQGAHAMGVIVESVEMEVESVEAIEDR